MTNNTINNLNLRIFDVTALKELNLGSQKSSEIIISINFEKAISVEHQDNSVLVINYQNGEIRLDLNRDQLEHIIKNLSI